MPTFFEMPQQKSFMIIDLIKEIYAFGCLRNSRVAFRRLLEAITVEKNRCSVIRTESSRLTRAVAITARRGSRDSKVEDLSLKDGIKVLYLKAEKHKLSLLRWKA